MAMSIAQQIGASITGNIEQAYLVISDRRQQSTSSTGGTGGQSGTGSAINRFKSMVTKLSDTLSGSTSSVPQTGPNDKIFKVQFNPSQLTVNASNLAFKKPDAQGSEVAMDAVTRPPMTMTVTLYFDEMNVFDSFMWDKYTSLLTPQLAKNAVSAVASAKGKVWTVRDEVEGLISALRNPLTRYITFRWADFSFYGQLNNISAQYTMFSTSGRPVRAKVTLRIRHEMDDSCLANWYKDYETAFAGDKKRLGGIQKTGNLLNIPL